MNLLGKLKATGIGIPISAINPGDGQAYQASGTLGTIIAWFCNIGRKLAGKQPAYLSHITIALRNPDDGTMWIFEDGEKSPWSLCVFKTPIAQRLTGAGTVFNVPLKVSLTDAQNAALWNLATKSLGQGYNVFELFALIPYVVSGEKIPPPPDWGGQVCSVFAASLWQSIGLPTGNPAGVTPDDVPDLSFVGPAQQVAT